MSSSLPYDRNTTLASKIAAEYSSLIAGKIILTTGVTQGGLGATFVAEIAKQKPALLILAGRTPSKVQATADQIAANPGSSGVETRVLALDLSSQEQIREAAKEVLAYPEDHIDVVVNSAGTMGGPFKTTAEGIESQFGSNHIGHFLFTNLVMIKILASENPRIVNVASDGHRYSGIRFDDPSFQDGKVYDQWDAYGQSKTANILFSKALAEKLGSRGLKAFSLHPGQSMGTSLAGGEFKEEDLEEITTRDKAMGWTRGFDWKTLDECAGTHVVAAFDPRLDAYNGTYLENGNLSEVEPTARRPEDAEKLWTLSEKLVGETFSY